MNKQRFHLHYKDLDRTELGHDNQETLAFLCNVTYSSIVLLPPFRKYEPLFTQASHNDIHLNKP